MDADHLVTRRRLRRRLGVWRLVAVVALAAVVGLAVGRWGGLSREHIARLTVDGLIVEDTNRDDRLAAVARDGDAKALIVRINSPGGTVVGGEALYRQLRLVSEHKPVVAVLGEVATSAAYMGALGTDRIIGRDGTITGSIGVILQSANITGMLAKLGIEPVVIKSDPLKAQPNPLEDLTPRARESIERVILDMQAMFVDVVRKRRNLTGAQVSAVADGRIFTGRQAVEAGLIDATGSDEDAREWLTRERDIDPGLQIRDVDIDDPFVRLSEVVVRGWQKAFFLEPLKLDGLVSLWHPALW